MNKINFTSTMICNDLRLRKLRLDDLKDLHNNCSSDQNVAKYCSWKRSDNIFDTEKVLKQWLKKYEMDYSYIWGIESIKDNELIGTISVVEINFNDKTCEVGYAIGERWWNKGYMTKCLSFVINFLFNCTEFEKIICKAQTKNRSSISVMEKNGMILYDDNEIYYNKVTLENDRILTYMISKQMFNSVNIIKSEYNNHKFEEFMSFYDKLYIKYKKLIEKINEELLKIVLENISINNQVICRYKELLEARKQLLVEIINQCVSFFDIIKKSDVIIYLTGSYSRESQTIYSDIDINYAYENELILKMQIVEELIAYILVNLFDVEYRDRIHPMGYLPLITNYKINRSNKFAILFNSGDMIINECRKNCYDVMYENYNMPRSIENIKSYILENNSINKINEFVYNHEIVYSKSNDDILMTSIIDKDNEIINSKAFIYYFNLLIEQILKEILYETEENYKNLKYIRDFKRMYKTKPSTMLYKSFMMIRRLKMFTSNNTRLELIKINFSILKDFIDDENLINNLQESYYDYIFELNRIEYAFKCSGKTLSSHSDELLTDIILKYDDLFYNDMMNAISSKVKKMYNYLIVVLERMKVIYDE